MAEIAERLSEYDPTNVNWLVSVAYATRRAEGLNAARNILINALPKFPREAIIYYNLACYDCQLGQIPFSKAILEASVSD